MNKTEQALLEITERFNRPEVEYIGSRLWRVRVDDRHIHLFGGHYGSFFASGVSPLAAARILLKRAEEHLVIKGDICSKVCPYYNS